MRCYMQVARWHGGIQVCIIHSFFSLLFFSAEEEEMDGVMSESPESITFMDSRINSTCYFTIF